MHDTAKYLIHADVRASGVVERSDVVGAVFGQTEGLLGDDLDLRDLQESGKLGRIDVQIESERGSSFGEITIASGLDRVETAILAAALESIERVGPCRADVEIATIEDVRSAKRRQVVERAKELLAEFDETTLSSDELIEEVRRSVRVEDITEYHGLPAGPRVADSDAVVVVEGRSDVQTLLGYGVKNAVAVEGTDVPEAVADLTSERTVTAFLDGDRAGDLILKELAQVGDVDYVALAPADRSVEDLSRDEVMSALRDKVPFETVAEGTQPSELAATDGSTRPAPPGTVEEPSDDVTDEPVDDATDGPQDESLPDRPSSPDATPATTADPGAQAETAVREPAPPSESTDGPVSDEGGPDEDERSTDERVDGTGGADGEAVDADDEEVDAADEPPQTLAGHVEAVVGGASGTVRLLDGEAAVIAEGVADEAFDLLENGESVPSSVVLDGEVTQRILDVAAQRGVEQVVAAREGEFVKQPTSVRVRLADEF